MESMGDDEIMVLDITEYDMSYFDGKKGALRHNAGYSEYKRHKLFQFPGSSGDLHKDFAMNWVNHLALSGKKVLEIGCAKGFEVEDLRDLGVNAYGLDVSDYCINTAEDSVANRRPEYLQYFYLGDARTILSQFKNKEFDYVYSIRFLECIDPADIPALVIELNRISKNQIHLVENFTEGNKSSAMQFYTQHTLQEWANNYSWNNGTRFYRYDFINLDLNQGVIK